MEALISFLPTPADGALGALDWSPAERRKLAKESVTFFCPLCKCHVKDLLPVLKEKKCLGGSSEKETVGVITCRFQKEILELQRLQLREHAKKASGDDQKHTSEVSVNDDQATTTVEPISDLVAAATSSQNDTSPIEQADDESPKGTSMDETPSIVNELSGVATENSAAAVTLQPHRTRDSHVLHDDNFSGADEAIPLLRGEDPLAQPHAAQHIDDEARTESSDALDLLLQAIIVLLSIIVYVLLRKIQALMSDLRALQNA